eukprot:PITA_17821
MLHVVDVNGCSGGIALGFNSRNINLCNIWGGIRHIGVDIYSSKLGSDIIILNVYGPCHNHGDFWDHLLNYNLLQIDSLSAFFENTLENHNLIDIPSTRIQPSWRNKRTGEDRLARRLDHFLIKERLLSTGYNYGQWVGSGGISNHLSIYLEIRGGLNKPKASFKFNSSWLKEETYINMVTDYWRKHPPAVGGNLAKVFTHNLREMKILSKIWAHNKTLLDEQTLRDIEAEIATLEDEQGRGHTTPDQKEKLTTLVAQGRKILNDREETWRLRSRAIWLLEGDDNKKFFHKYANGRKSINTIWHLKND